MKPSSPTLLSVPATLANRERLCLWLGLDACLGHPGRADDALHQTPAGYVTRTPAGWLPVSLATEIVDGFSINKEDAPRYLVVDASPETLQPLPLPWEPIPAADLPQDIPDHLATLAECLWLLPETRPTALRATSALIGLPDDAALEAFLQDLWLVGNPGLFEHALWAADDTATTRHWILLPEAQPSWLRHWAHDRGSSQKDIYTAHSPTSPEAPLLWIRLGWRPGLAAHLHFDAPPTADDLFLLAPDQPLRRFSRNDFTRLADAVQVAGVGPLLTTSPTPPPTETRQRPIAIAFRWQTRETPATPGVWALAVTQASALFAWMGRLSEGELRDWQIALTAGDEAWMLLRRQLTGPIHHAPPSPVQTFAPLPNHDVVWQPCDRRLVPEPRHQQLLPHLKAVAGQSPLATVGVDADEPTTAGQADAAMYLLLPEEGNRLRVIGIPKAAWHPLAAAPHLLRPDLDALYAQVLHMDVLADLSPGGSP